MDERYKRLAIYVLRQAVDDYYTSLRYGSMRVKMLRDIDDLWFIASGIDKEWFIESLVKEGERRYGEKLSNKSKI